MEKKKIIKILSLTIAVIAILWATHYFGVYQYLTPQRIRDFVLSFGILAPIIYIIIYVLRSFFLFSASVLSITGGLAFGPLWGTVYTVIGATLSSSLTFWLVRWFGRDFMNATCKSCGTAIEGLDEKIGNKGFWFILFLRLVPIFPYEGINFAAGLSKINFRNYFWGTFLGIIPGSFAFNYLGGSLLNIRDPKIILAITLVLLTMFIPTIYKMIKR
ncbi:MAG: TVP38/TMEM64 family protein [Candidatus Saganbacteria bacterium]|nr:TVP38/TMEM64 family protein [Candidatus Saganbacteria bacterium]